MVAIRQGASYFGSCCPNGPARERSIIPLRCIDNPFACIDDSYVSSRCAACRSREYIDEAVGALAAG